MNTRLVFWLALLFPVFATGQVNLVLNPSLEDTFRCSNDSNVIKTKVWFTPNTHSPDFFYPSIQGNPSCVDQYPELWGGGSYSNNWGFSMPNSGLAYIGMGVAQGSELVAGKLSDSLIAGKKYSVSFYTSLGDAYFGLGAEGLDLISFCFMQDSSSDYTANDWTYLATLTVDAGNQAGNFLTDTASWMLVTDTFTAEGGERYFVLGNIDINNTQYVNSSIPTPCYYYFDDFDVHCIDCIADTFEPPAYPEIVVTPSISSGEIILSGNLPEGTKFEVYDLLGQLVYYNELQNGNQTRQIFLQLAEGVYSYRVVSNNNVLKADKLVVVR